MKITNSHVFFYTEWPSNFKATSFEWEAFGEKHRFFCTEQAFMWAKAKYFGDEDIAKAILSETSDPMTCKHLGRMVSNYNDKKWDLVRYSFMYDVNFCKYTQDKELQNKLLDPKFEGKTFVEASPTDKIWGIGLAEGIPDHVLDNENNWKGTNLLGKVITRVRQIIKSDIENKIIFG